MFDSWHCLIYVSIVISSRRVRVAVLAPSINVVLNNFIFRQIQNVWRLEIINK